MAAAHLATVAAATPSIPAETLTTMDPYDFVPDLAPDIANLAAMLPVVIAEGLRKSPAPLGPERSADESFVRAAR